MKKITTSRVLFFILCFSVFLGTGFAQNAPTNDQLDILRSRVEIERYLTKSLSNKVDKYHREYYDYLKHDFSGVENRTQKKVNELNSLRGAKASEYKILQKELEYLKVKRQELTAKMSTYEVEDAWAWDNFTEDYIDMVVEDVIYIVKNIDWKEVFKPLIECVSEFDLDKCKDVRTIITNFCLQAMETTWKKNFIDDLKSELKVTTKIAEDVWDSYVLPKVDETQIQKLANMAKDSLMAKGEKKFAEYMTDKVVTIIEDEKLIGKSKEEATKYLNDQAKEAAEKHAKDLFAAATFASDMFWKAVNIYAGLEFVEEMKPMIENRMVWVREAAGCSDARDANCAMNLTRYYLNDNQLRARLKRIRGERAALQIPPKPGQTLNSNSKDDAILVKSEEDKDRGKQTASSSAPSIEIFQSSYEDIYNAYYNGQLYHTNYLNQASSLVTALDNTVSDWHQNNPGDSLAPSFYERVAHFRERVTFDQNVCSQGEAERKFELEQIYNVIHPEVSLLRQNLTNKLRTFGQDLQNIQIYVRNGDQDGFYAERDGLFRQANEVVELYSQFTDLVSLYYDEVTQIICEPDHAAYFWKDGVLNTSWIKPVEVSVSKYFNYSGCESLEVPSIWIDLSMDVIANYAQQIEQLEYQMISQASIALLDDVTELDDSRKMPDTDLSAEQRATKWDFVSKTDRSSQVQDNFEELYDALELYHDWLEVHNKLLNESQGRFTTYTDFVGSLSEPLANLEYDLQFGMIDEVEFTKRLNAQLDRVGSQITNSFYAIQVANDYCYSLIAIEDLKTEVTKRIERYQKLSELLGTDYQVERMIDKIRELEGSNKELQDRVMDKFISRRNATETEYMTRVCKRKYYDYMRDTFEYKGVLGCDYSLVDSTIQNRLRFDQRDASSILHQSWRSYYTNECTRQLHAMILPGIGRQVLSGIMNQLGHDLSPDGWRTRREQILEMVNEYLLGFASNAQMIPDCNLADDLNAALDRTEAENTDENWVRADELAAELDIRDKLNCVSIESANVKIFTHWYFDPCIMEALHRYDRMKYGQQLPYFYLKLDGRPVQDWQDEWSDYNSIKIVGGNGKIILEDHKVSPLLDGQIAEVLLRVCKSPVHLDMEREHELFDQCITRGEFEVVARNRSNFRYDIQLSPDYVYQIDYRIKRMDESLIIPTGSPVKVQWWKDDTTDIEPPVVVQQEGTVTLECFHGEGSFVDGYEFATNRVQRTGETGVDKPEVNPDIYFSDNVFAESIEGFKIADIYDYGTMQLNQVNWQVPSNDPGFKPSGIPEKGHSYGYYLKDETFILMEILNIYEKPYNHYHLNGVEFKWRSGDPGMAAASRDDGKSDQKKETPPAEEDQEPDVAGTSNELPHAVLSVTTVSGGPFIAPVIVQFNPRGSYDPDGEIVLFELDKDGDGQFEVSEAGLHGSSMEFTTPGTYTAVLRVIDNAGGMRVTTSTFHIFSGAETTGQVDYEVKLELNKNYYLPGERMRVYFDKDKLENRTSWLGIVPSSIAHGSEYENQRHSEQKTILTDKTGTIHLRAPRKTGLYDVRMHDRDDNGLEIASASFIVLDKDVQVPETQVKEKPVVAEEKAQVSDSTAYSPIIVKVSPLRVFEGLIHGGVEYQMLGNLGIEVDFGYYYNIPPILYHEPLVPIKDIFDEAEKPFDELVDLADSYTYWPLNEFWLTDGKGFNLTGAAKLYFDGHLKGQYLGLEYRYKRTSWGIDEEEEEFTMENTATAINLVFGRQKQLNNTLWSDIFIGWGIRNVKLENSWTTNPYEERFFTNFVMGWKLGFRF